MITIEREVSLPYSAEQLFELVDDIENYPEFVPGCRSVHIINRTPNETHASVHLAVAGIQETITTRNQCNRPHDMRMVLAQTGGPFRTLNGTWKFEPQDTGCLVRVSAQIECRSRILQAVAVRAVPVAANRMLDIMCRRADQLYGLHSHEAQ